MITTEAECKKACNSLEGINRFVVGKWPDSPGCFYFTGNKNCHWNMRTDVKWGAKRHRAVCGPKEEIGMYKTLVTLKSCHSRLTLTRLWNPKLKMLVNRHNDSLHVKIEPAQSFWACSISN